jgi:hypothetical protein
MSGESAPSKAGPLRNDKGQLIIPLRERHQTPPTLQNIREGMLIVFYTNPPENQWTNEANWLRDYLMLLLGEDAGKRRRRLEAALDAVDYDANAMQALRYFVRERFGDWNPDALTVVHDWLVAERGWNAESAWDISAIELLSLLRAKEGAKEEMATAKELEPLWKPVFGEYRRFKKALDKSPGVRHRQDGQRHMVNILDFHRWLRVVKKTTASSGFDPSNIGTWPEDLMDALAAEFNGHKNIKNELRQEKEKQRKNTE